QFLIRGRWVGRTDTLRQPIAIDNRSGPGGTLGTAVAARVPADGHHLLIPNTLPHTSAEGLLCQRYSPPSGSLLCLASHMNPPKTDQHGSSKPIPKWG
ncbi:hypothetical protein J8G26_14340, partial [Acidovorax sp. JG5]|nr:hypothetical protein [Acidovorax sp. JG5]